MTICPHDKTYFIPPNGFHDSVEVCEACGLSRSHWEQGQSEWRQVDLTQHPFSQPKMMRPVLDLIRSEPNIGICLEGLFNSTCQYVREMQDIVDAVKFLIDCELVHLRRGQHPDLGLTDFYMPGPPSRRKGMFPMHQCEQQEHHRLEELKTSGDIKAYTLTRNRKGEDGRDSECLTITLPNGKELQIFSCPRYGDDAGEEATCLHIQ